MNFKRVAMVVSGMLVGATALPAQVLPFFVGNPGSETRLSDVSTSFVVGDKEFSNFTVSGDIDAADITITGGYNANDPSQIGVRFTLSGFVLPFSSGTESFSLSYQVHVLDPQKSITGATLDLSGSVLIPTALAVIGQKVDDTTTTLGNLTVFQSELGPDSLLDSLSFAPATDLQIVSSGLIQASSTGLASITSFDQYFDQIPEPGTYALIFSALALGAVAIVRRQNRRFA